MNFEESVKYLYSLGNEVSAMKLGLENPKRLLQALENPQNYYLKVQVAGTNGKGSTCAFLDSICRSAGIKTGLYTSPHLVSITERIKIDGQAITEKDFAEYATRVREITESEKLYATFFEQITAIALLAFAENGVDLAILETGLGGRLDATTAANAEIVAITPIDYDHQQYLGETLTEIAGEKAAIINSSKQKVVISKQQPEAEKVIKGRCLEIGVEPIWATKNIKTKEHRDAGNSIISTSFKTEKGNYPDIMLGLEGTHQTENAAVAIALAEILNEYGFKISSQNIWIGLETATHKGRLEFYKGILFDGAHNIAGAKALKNHLEKYYSGAKIVLIFGAMKDKQISEIAEILFPLAEDLILTQPNNPRAATVEELNEIAEKIIDEKKILLIPNVADAIDIARHFSANHPVTDHSLICVTGSLYLVGEAQKVLANK
ncbi:MAG: bifunctional folylpolyglutamate synthase/dihydrofolate synthase [Pyrinomonadaceae bacterium]|nr:bifunctional folylpolyglutamate synthase/dihydrofolate synthase [Pyrinomonadaceae bacterium]